MTHRDPVKDWLKENIPILSKGKVLEFGACGGDFREDFKEGGFEWFGLDKEGGFSDIKKGLIQDLDEENKYSVIFSCHTFEHVENPIEALRKINKSLISGGVILNATPLFVQDQILEGSDTDHIFVLHPWNLTKLYLYTGFNDVQIWETGKHNRRDSIISLARKQ